MKKAGKRHPWQASYPKHLAWDHMIDAKPLYTILDQAAAKFPEHTAIDFLGKTYSYQQLHRAVNCAARALKAQGVKKGVRVGLLLPNCPQAVIGYYAILKTGGTVVNLSPLQSQAELTHQASIVKMRFVITVNLEATYPKARKLVEEGLIETLITSCFSEALPAMKGTLFSLLKRKEVARVTKDSHHLRWKSLFCGKDQEFEPPAITPEEDIAVLQFTGGTTGVPKAAMLTHANLYANAQQCALWCGLLTPGKERMMGVLPLFHCFAMTLIMNMGLMLGCRLILHPRFNIEATLKDIARKKVTLLPGVPTLFAAIANHPHLKRFNLRSLKICISGGAPLPMEVREYFEEVTGCKLLEGYGLTETSPVAACNPLEGKQKACIGLPFPQTEIKIEDMKRRGHFLKAGEVGELCIKGPQVMRGYWQKKAETEKIIRKKFLRTGDIGYMDEEGYFYIVDRLKDMIISHGFNVYPRNVEEAIYKHPAVLEAAVTGIPDKKYGQVVKAHVVRRPGKVLTEDELRAFLQDLLARYEIPRVVEFKERLPKTTIGKIDKKQLS
jgi:long-chain acyl-CoA synthetase